MYTDGSFSPQGGPLVAFCCPTEILHRGGGGIVLIDPSENWPDYPVVCIHLEDPENYLHARSVFPYELGSIILALTLSSHFGYGTHIYTDSKSSMDTLLKPRKKVDSAREYYPFIAAGKSLLRSTGTVLRKIAAHPERTEPNHHRWSRHQWGNVLADRVAGDQPIQPRPQAWTEANVHHFRIDARHLLVHTNEFMPLAWAETERAGGNNLLVQSTTDFLKQTYYYRYACPGERRVERTHRPN
jgi:hypothetical protein